MKNIIVIIGLLIILVTNTGCPKSNCIKANYAFAATMQFKPDLDSIRLGDTVYLSSSFSTNLTDQPSGNSINYTNSIGIGSTLGLVKLINGKYPGTDAVNSFNYRSIIGSIYNDNSIPSPNKIQQLKFAEVSNIYHLKIGIIPKEKGVYYLGVGNGVSIGRDGSNGCEKADFNFTVSNTAQHLYYFNQWTPNASLSDYERSRAYFFKVY